MAELKFEILESTDPEVLIFADFSNYKTAPIAALLQLKFPNLAKVYSVPVSYSNYNFINTAGVGYTECATEFPDGVYTVTYSIQGCKLCKKIFRITKALSTLKTMLENSDLLDYNKDLLNRFNKINLYLQGAVATVGKSEAQANALYAQANALLNCNNDINSDKNVWMFKECSSC